MNKDKNVLHMMFVLVHHLKKGFQEFLSQGDLTEMEAKIIFFMEGTEVKTSEIIRHFKKHKSTITQKTKSLEEKGYVLFVSDAKDKRQRNIQLTQKGLEFRSNMKSLEEEYRNSVFKDFTKAEKKELLRLLEKIDINYYEKIC